MLKRRVKSWEYPGLVTATCPAIAGRQPLAKAEVFGVAGCFDPKRRLLKISKKSQELGKAEKRDYWREYFQLRFPFQAPRFKFLGIPGRNVSSRGYEPGEYPSKDRDQAFRIYVHCYLLSISTLYQT